MVRYGRVHYQHGDKQTRTEDHLAKDTIVTNSIASITESPLIHLNIKLYTSMEKDGIASLEQARC